MPKITPQEYNKIINGLDIVNIALKECKAQILRDPEPELVVTLKSEASFKQLDDSMSIVTQRYSLSAVKKDVVILSIDCIYNLSYKTVDKMTDDFFELFKDTSLPTVIWPFFREFVNDITSKMQLPPLILPLFKAQKP